MSGGWPNARLHAVFGCELRHVDRVALERLIQAEVDEHVDLEFKSKFYSNGEKDRHELAKDVGAMADRGGVIVGGLAAKDSGQAMSLIDISLADGEETRVRQTLASRLDPLPVVELLRVPAESGSGFGQWLAIIPASNRAPHAVTRPDGSLTYFTRHGTTTRPLAQTEVADRYMLRQARGRKQGERAAEVMDVGRRSLATHDATWIAMTLVPEWPGQVETTAAALEAHRRWSEQWQQSTSGSVVDVAASRAHTVGFRRLIVSNDHRFSGTSHYGHYEAHADGAGFAAVTYGRLIGAMKPPPSGLEEHQHDLFVDQDEVAFGILVMLDLLVRQALEFSGAGGDALVLTELVSPIPWRPTWLIFGHPIRGPSAVPGTRSVEDPSRSDRGVSLAALLNDPRELVIAARSITSDLLSEFGQSRWNGWTQEGGVRPLDFGQNAQQVRQWATYRGVTIEESS